MMQLSIIFLFIGILVFIILGGIAAKLYHFKGGKLRMRIYYELGLSLLFTLIFFWYFWYSNKEMDITVVGKSIIFSSILCLPIYYLTIRNIKRRMKGNVIYYERGHAFKSILRVGAIVIVTKILYYTDVGRQIFTSWVILGLCFAWFISQIFILISVAKLERGLGTSIQEIHQ